MNVELAVVIGSSRPGRLGERIARLVLGATHGVAGVGPVVFDLAEHVMPFFAEPVAPFAATDRHPAPAVARWLDVAARVDGFVFITPEYDHAPPAVLKNALDHLGREAELKPAAVVAYSETPRGGSLAGELLKLSLTKLGMLPMPHTVAVPFADTLVAADGSPRPHDATAGRVTRALRRTWCDLAAVSAAVRDRANPEVA